MSEYNDIEHRAFWETPVCPEIKLSVPGGIGNVYIGPIGVKPDAEEEWNEAVKHGIIVPILDFKAPKKHDKQAEEGGHQVNFTTHPPRDFHPALKGNGGFIIDRLKVSSLNTMPCPHCAMQCEKTHDGYFQRTKYEYFRCYNCKKSFKITL